MRFMERKKDQPLYSRRTLKQMPASLLIPGSVQQDCWKKSRTFFRTCCPWTQWSILQKRGQMANLHRQEALPLRQVNKPLSIRPKRLAVQLQSEKNNPVSESGQKKTLEWFQAELHLTAARGTQGTIFQTIKIPFGGARFGAMRTIQQNKAEVNTFGKKNSEKYSQRRAGELSNREILANAFEGMARNETELDSCRQK